MSTPKACWRTPFGWRSALGDRSVLADPPIAGMRAGRLATGLLIAILCLCSAAAYAQEQKKQPPPEFSSGYFPPTPTTPAPRADLFGTIDVVVLAVVLALTAWFVLRARNRTMVRVLTVFSVLYFGFYRLGCVCAVGSIQNVALAVGDNAYRVPIAVAAIFALPLLFALFFGRVFCAAACPLGAIQDLVLLRPRRTPPAVDHSLGLLPYAYLGLGVLFAWTGSAFVICKYDPFIPFYRLGGPWGIIATGAALLAIGTVIGRPYCRYLCPYGVLLRWAGTLARWRVKITPKGCLHCHLCADECPFNAIRPPTKFEKPVDRTYGRKQLIRALIALPILVVVFGTAGYAAAPVIARVDHRVALAERLWAEERGVAKGTTNETEAYRRLALPNAEAYRQAAAVRRRFDIGSTLLGAWIGLLPAGKLISLTLRRRREDYETDAAGCYACARCYMSCPVEHERLGLITIDR